jgi:hypothetical protein
MNGEGTNTMPEAANDEHRAEAERLAQLPRDVQRQIVAMHRADAQNPKVPKHDREYARERAKALERLLRLEKRKKK